METSRKWLHELGFHVLDQKKGNTLTDMKEMMWLSIGGNSFVKFTLEFINKDNAPAIKAAQCLPSDLERPPTAILDKTVVIFHDELIFLANEDQRTQWGSVDMHSIKPKDKGAGIMVSDFIDEHIGYLRLYDEGFEQAKVTYGPIVKKEARELLEYGDNKEEYWTSENFLAQVDKAVKIPNIKYPPEDGFKVVWIFDKSSCHNDYSDDALIAAHMNAKPGGKQAVMRDTIWDGKPQRMAFNIGVPKGLIQVLKERSKYHPKTLHLIFFNIVLSR